MRRIMSPKIQLLMVLCLLGMGATVYSHCQMPCGIYDDPARIQAMAENITTLEKSIQQINALSGKTSAQDNNQVVRWIMTKDAHADELSETITYYFMAQRIKPSAPTDTKAYAKYIRELTLLHQMLQTSMKVKQTVDLAHIQTLRSQLHDFSDSYLGAEADHTH